MQYSACALFHLALPFNAKQDRTILVDRLCVKS